MDFGYNCEGTGQLCFSYILIPGNGADYYVFRGDSCFSCYDVFNLGSLGIGKAGSIDYHIHAGAADAYHNITEAFCFQKGKSPAE